MSMLRNLGLLLLLLVFCLGAAISYSNADLVSFDYLIGTAQMRLVVLLLLTFTLGVIITVLLCGLRLFNQRREIGRLRKQLRGAETELKNLRNLPLKSL